MAQNTVSTKPGATYVGIETTFATAATTTRIYPVESSVELDLQQDEVVNESEQPSLFETPAPVRGLKSTNSTAKWRQYFRPLTTQLTGSATTTAATPPCMIPVKACLGGESFSHNSGVGTTVTSGTVSTLTVAATAGLAIGQWVLVNVGGVLEPTRIYAISGSVLTVNPELSGAPTSAAALYGMATYYPTEANTQSLTLQRALSGDANLQWTATGGIPALDLKIARNEIIEYGASAKFASWTGPSAQGISTAIATDPSAAPWVLRDGLVLFQASTAPTRTVYSLIECGVKLNPSLDFVPELVGSTEGAAGVYRRGARPFAEVTIKFRSDTAMNAIWTTQTKMQLIVMASQGSGTSKRWLVFDLPTAIVVGKPKWTGSGDLAVVEMTLQAQLHLNVNNPAFVPGTSDLQHASYRIALG